MNFSAAGFVLAAIGLVAALAWFVIGPINATSAAGPDFLDYMARAPDNIGTYIVVAGLGCAVVLIMLRQELSVSDWQTITYCTSAGIIFSITSRLVTAGTLGANIGGGMALLVAPPTVALLLWLAYRRQTAQTPHT